MIIEYLVCPKPGLPWVKVSFTKIPKTSYAIRKGKELYNKLVEAINNLL